MDRERALLVLAVLLGGCTDGGKEEPDCFHDTGGWTGDTGYAFYEGNFACDTGGAISTPFTINTSSFQSKASLTPSEVMSDFDAARGEWNAVGADVTISRSATATSKAINKDDGEFAVFMSTGHSKTNDNELAHASQWHYGANAVDCDIEVWTQVHTGDDPETTTVVEAERVINLTWTTSTPPSASQLHLESVLLHELGHCLGFDHNDIDGSVMKPGLDWGDDRGAPSAVDELALFFLYGP